MLSNGTVISALAHDFAGEAGANQGLSSWTELWAFTSESARRMWEELTPVPTRRNSNRHSPSVLFPIDRSAYWYEVAADGQRFLVPLPVAGPPSSMTVVLNWTELLKQRVPTR